MKKLLLKILIYALVISAFLGIVIILFGLESELATKVLCTTALVFGFSIPGLCCSTIYEKEGKKELSICGMLVCGISCLYLILNIWTEFELFPNFEDNYKVILIMILLACSFGHISLLLLVKPKTKSIETCLKTTIILSVLIDSLFIFRILIENDDHLKIDAILAILIALGTVVVPIMNKVTKVDDNIESGNEIIRNTTPVKMVETEVVGEIKEDDKYEKLEKLKKLLDMEAITQEEFEEEKKKILN